MSSLKDLISRWIMRGKEAGTVMQIPLWGLTAVSTMVTAIRGTPYEQYTFHAIAFLVIGIIIFAWFYDRRGILRDQQRERMDRSDNFAGPGIAINALIHAQQYAALAAAINNDDDFLDAEQRLNDATRRALTEFRDGVDLEDVFGDGEQPTQPILADGGDEK